MVKNMEKAIQRFNRRYKEVGGYDRFVRLIEVGKTLEEIGAVFSFTRQYASLKKIDINHVESIYKMLRMVATSPPERMNYNSITNALDKNIYVVMEMARLLRDIGLVMGVLPEGAGSKAVRKEYKMLLMPPFRSVICRMNANPASVGALREEFFVLHAGHENVRYIKSRRQSKASDYRLGKWSFEIGGERKDSDYRVSADLSMDEETIPLALFGLLY